MSSSFASIRFVLISISFCENITTLYETGRVSSIQTVVVRGMGKNAVVPMDNDLKAEKQK